MTTTFCPVPEAIAAVARGGIVVVTDDEQRENEGDLIMAAEFATAETMAFFVRHTSGVVCAAAPGPHLDRLGLAQMVPSSGNDESMGTAFTVTVDARVGTTTGISAADRAATVRALADPDTLPIDLVRPGHVFPLRARPMGVLERPGHTEASVDLARLAGLRPVGVLAEVTLDDGRMARLPDLREFCARHRLPLVSIAAIAAHRMRTEQLVTPTATAEIPTRWGRFTAHTFRSTIDGREHVALTLGVPAAGEATLARVHSECLTGDVFGSRRCDCGEQLADAMRTIGRRGAGAIVYVRGHEGRGIGLAQKLRAYRLQDEGADTVDANIALGLPADAREYGVAAQILRSIGIDHVQLLTNNPAKVAALTELGITVVDRIPLLSKVTGDNIRYLAAKRDRMGHLIEPFERDEVALADSVGIWP